MKRWPVGRGAHGFTLVEVLVAMMIMSILALMAWQGVDGIVRTRDASQERLERTLRMNTVLAQWEQDIQAVQDSPAVPGFTFDGGTVRLTRRAERGLQVVTWSLLPGPEGTAGGGTWLRWAGAPVATGAELQEAWMRTQQFQGNEPGQLRTLGGLVQWQVYCYWSANTSTSGSSGWSNCQSTGNQAPQAPAPGAAAPQQPVRQSLPAGVRLVLELGGEVTGNVTRDVLLSP